MSREQILIFLFRDMFYARQTETTTPEHVCGQTQFLCGVGEVYSWSHQPLCLLLFWKITLIVVVGRHAWPPWE